MNNPKKRSVKACVFIVTDLCMWEMQKQNGGRAPHAIGVADEKTGKSRFIKTGARIKFLSGKISPELSQESYNKLTSPKPKSKKKLT